MALGVEVAMTANTAQLNTGVEEANRLIGNIGSGAEAASGGLTRLLGLAGAGIAAGAGTIALLTAGTIKAANELGDLSEKTGISVQNLAGLQRVTDDAGLSLDAATGFISKFAESLSNDADAFAKIGITAKDPLDAFEQLADVFNRIDDPQTRAAFGAKALGDNWQEAVPLLRLGSAELANLIKKEGEVSGFTDKLADAAGDIDKQFSNLQKDVSNLGTQAVAPLIPMINALTKSFFDNNGKVGISAEGNKALSKSYEFIIKSIGLLAVGVEVAGSGVSALASKLNALIHLDFGKFDAIDKAFDLSVANAQFKFIDLLKRLKQEAGDSGINIPINVDQGNEQKTGSISNAGEQKVNQNLQGLLGDQSQAIKNISKSLESDLSKHNKAIEQNITDETDLYNFRNQKLQLAFELGNIDEANFYQQKEQLQKDNLAVTEDFLDQEINALQAYLKQQQDAIDNQIRAQEKLRDSTKSEVVKQQAQTNIDGLQEQKLNIESEAQQKINALAKEKINLERESQLQTLQNAAAARKVLGEQAEGLININGLLEQQIGNIIGLSKAQAELNVQIGGTASAEDVVNKKKIFVSEDGKSFSDRPTEVGVQLNLDEANAERVQQQLINFRDKAIADSAILLGVDIDQPKAIAKINEASSSINQKLTEIKPVRLGMDVDQALVVSAAQKAREAAQAAVQPVIIPVVYQARNTPATAAAGGVDLTQAALASGGR